MRRLRTLTGLSGRDVARRLGVNQSTISRMERGDARLPALAWFEAFADTVNASPEVRVRLLEIAEAAHLEVTAHQVAATEKRHRQADRVTVESLQAEVAELRRLVAHLQEYLRHLYDRLGQPYPGRDMSSGPRD